MLPTFNNEAQQVYDRLWAQAVTGLHREEVQVDPYLQQRELDRRAGISLIARPGAGVCREFSGLLEQLKEQEPDQYFYRPPEFHVTVLTLITSSPEFRLAQVPVEAYHSVFSGLFQEYPPFTIRFRGVTASPAAILAQGYADGDSLNRLRTVIRQKLDSGGLGATLDVRYHIVTAHVTLMRFKSRPRSGRQLLALLNQARQRNFGSTGVMQVDFVVNDWYMSQDKVRVLKRYRLNGKA